jgi:hypothetical protein
MTTIPIAAGQLMVLGFVVLPATSALIAVLVQRFYSRAERRELRIWRRELRVGWQELNVQHGLLDEREQAVATAELRLGEHARAVGSTIRAEAEDFDTMISLNFDSLPHPYENDTTVVMPRIEE